MEHKLNKDGKKVYDVVIVGSGLGGFVSAIILAKEGLSVCVLEKNNQYGGNLQTFVRNKTIFDTGVHYIGGLEPGQNLYHYFNYIEIMEDLPLHKLDDDGFDIITFDDDEKEYKHAMGYDNFIKALIKDFPEEENAIRIYCAKVQEICNKFPLYSLKKGEAYFGDKDAFELPIKQYLEDITDNAKLRAVLGGTNTLYAGDEYKTPFYVHALAINSYIESSFRCINGGSQMTKLLVKKLKKYGGEIYKHQEVVDFTFNDEGKIASVKTKKGDEFFGNLFISNIEPKTTLKMVGEKRFKKPYVSRVEKIETTIAPFSLYLVLKKDSFKYQNKNYYHFKDHNRIWAAQDYTQESWPEGYMLSMGINKNHNGYGDNLTAMTYMHYDEVEQWEDTFNTVAHKNDRGQTYDEFKSEKAEKFIVEIEKKFPNIRECIEEVYTSTPLSYRDYIGSHRGAMYGYAKDAGKPLYSHLSPKTKVKNLFFTGQSINMHGILGVTISAVITCAEIIDKEYLIDKILNYEKVEMS
ncbi:NAD(P)/FAD-dependent oxidoreductase [uncultured Lacinutrix sp.]|uniref:phytoene desaturase family protein n=1 Tax=uncultured Lacinutrix sp. TaxID=574032 RepID=UPI00261B3182|nr:NAD(P)/FAD-dependent oxidoreductase [uncultured Lacinutrix sp.]